MSFLALGLIALAAWLIWTGRLQRLTANDGIALGLAIVGAVLSAKGKPIIGALPLFLSVGYMAWRLPRTKRKKAANRAPSPAQLQAAEAVAEASALLGVARDADVETIRAAHRRLIASVHPDKGGTEALAARINAARDTMLRHHETSTRPRH